MKYYLVIPPQFESLALEELMFWSHELDLDIENIECLKGGIEFDCGSSNCLQLNYYLKIPSRILLRVKQFRCKDYKRLQQKIKNLPWREYLGQGAVSWSVSSHQSRVYNKKNIEEACQKAYLDFCKGQPAKKSSSNHSLKIFVRFDSDTCTVSIDTSGELLHKRGYKRLSTNAPLRENIAAGLLQLCLKHLPANQSLCVLDPMCGSGTFLGEAFNLNRSSQGFREYTFEHFKSYAISERISNASAFTTYIGLDADQKAIEATTSNLSRLKIPEFLVNQLDCNDIKQNFHPDLVIFNPPYGERIKVKGGSLIDFYLISIEQLFKTQEPKALAVLLPRGVVTAKALTTLGYKALELFKFSNSGIDVEFLILSKKS